jgi:hypothetical protein
VLHVEEVVVEAAMAGGVRLLALGTVAEEPQRSQRPRGGIATGEEAPLRADDIGGEAEPGSRYAARRTFSGTVGDQPIVRVRGSEEVSDGVLLESFEILYARRRLSHVPLRAYPTRRHTMRVAANCTSAR